MKAKVMRMLCSELASILNQHLTTYGDGEVCISFDWSIFWYSATDVMRSGSNILIQSDVRLYPEDMKKVLEQNPIKL